MTTTKRGGYRENSGSKPHPPELVASVRIVANVTPAEAQEWARRGRTAWLRAELRRKESTTGICILEMALFTQAPKIGGTDCTHEARYAGYKRVPMLTDGKTNLHAIFFPASEQDEEVFVTHVAAIDASGVIVSVNAL